MSHTDETVSIKKAPNFLFLKDYLIAGASKAIGRTITAPIDRHMLLLHEPHIKFPFSRFWSGNLLQTIKSFFPNFVVFSFSIKDWIKRNDWLLPYGGVESNGYRFVLNQFLSGGMAGGVCTFGLLPFDNLMKFRIGKLGTGIEKYFGLFRGGGLAITGSVVYYSVYFGLNDSLREVNSYRNDLGVKGFISRYGIALLATVSASIISSPIGTIRGRMIMQQENPQRQLRYSSSIDCFKKILENEGISSFFRMLRLYRMVGPALILTLYDHTHCYLFEQFEQREK